MTTEETRAFLLEEIRKLSGALTAKPATSHRIAAFEHAMRRTFYDAAKRGADERILAVYVRLEWEPGSNRLNTRFVSANDEAREAWERIFPPWDENGHPNKWEVFVDRKGGGREGV